MVVSNDMYGASAAKLGQVRQGQGLVGAALPRESGIAVTLNVEAFCPIVHFCLCFPHADSVLGLQVTWIVYRAESHTMARLRTSFCAEALAIGNGDMCWHIV